jgi:hypothetical protein
MVELVSLASECGSQPTRRRESNAVVSPPSSHSAGLTCPGHPGHNPANHLRAQLGGARTIRPRREAPNGEGANQSLASITTLAAEGRERWREGGRGEGGDWGALGSQGPAAGRPAKSPSSRLRWLLRPSCPVQRGQIILKYRQAAIRSWGVTVWVSV